MKTLHTSLFALLIACFAIDSHAALHVWTGAVSNRFSDAGNWRGGSPAGDSSAELSFPNGAAHRVVMNDLHDLTVRVIAFSGSGYVIDGNAIAAAAEAQILDSSSDANVIRVEPPRQPNAIAVDLVLAGGLTIVNRTFDPPPGLTFVGAIGGAGPVVIPGDGVITFSGSRPNTYSGLTHVLKGELRLAKSAHVAAVPGDLVLAAGRAFQITASNVRVTALSPEQIADTATVRLGSTAFLSAHEETLGPIELAGGSGVSSYGYGAAAGRGVTLAGDITIVPGNGQPSSVAGRLARNLVVTTCATCEDFTIVAREHTAGAGLTVRGGAAPYGTVVVGGTFTGPVVVEGPGEVRVSNSRTAVRLLDGSFVGGVASLTAEGGSVGSRIFDQKISISGDVRLSPAVTVLSSPERGITAGSIDLAGAKLSLTVSPLGPQRLGQTHTLVQNNGSGATKGHLCRPARRGCRRRLDADLVCRR